MKYTGAKALGECAHNVHFWSGNSGLRLGSDWGGPLEHCMARSLEAPTWALLGPFDSRLLVEEDGGRFWRLARPLTYTGARDTFVVPAGFRTDLASVPRVFWALLPPFGPYQRAAVVHDWLCRNRQVSYRDADGVFRRILRESGVPRWQRYLLYAGVRVGHVVLRNRGTRGVAE